MGQIDSMPGTDDPSNFSISKKVQTISQINDPVETVGIIKELDAMGIPEEERKEMISKVVERMDSLFMEAGAEKFSNLTEALRNFKGKQLFARREYPERVIKAFEDGQGIQIAHDPNVGNIKKDTEGRYANCVEFRMDWSGANKALHAANVEGYGGKGGVTVVVFFEKGDMDITTGPPGSSESGGRDRIMVRSAVGTVETKNIVAVDMVVPHNLFSGDLTYEEEVRIDELEDEGRKEDAERMKIHRGYVFTREQE